MTRIIAILSISITILGACSNAALAEKKSRFNEFMSILPKDIQERYDTKSPKYGENLLQWRAEAKVWIEKTFQKETNRQRDISNMYYRNPEMYNYGMLTNRFYERENPFTLMEEIKPYSDEIAELMKKSVESDSSFSNRLHSIMTEEAIPMFSIEDTAFYFLWNYVITFDRPRRFQ